MIDKSAILNTNWLQRCWKFEICPVSLCGKTSYTVKAGACDVAVFQSEHLAQAWIDRYQPLSLAQVFDSYPAFSNSLVVIEAGRSGRLGRLRPALWSTYDALPVIQAKGCLTILSAKARAMFPEESAVFIRAYAGRGR